MTLLRGLFGNRIQVEVTSHDGPDMRYVAIAAGDIRRGDQLLWGGDVCFIKGVTAEAEPYLTVVCATGPFPTIHLHHREEIFVLTPRPPTPRENEIP